MATKRKDTLPLILDGTYFEIITIDSTGGVTAKCTACNKNIKGRKQPTSNFTTHLQTQHAAIFLKYKDSIAGLDKRQKLLEFPVIKSVTTFKEKIERLTLNYIVQSMSPVVTVEKPEFIALVKGLNSVAELPTRKTLMNRISLEYDRVQTNLILAMQKPAWICATADIWSNHRRSFMGVTAHWITEDFERKSCLLTLTRFPGSHTAEKIAELLLEVFHAFKINKKICCVITDNATNFAKAFREFGTFEEEADSDADLEEELEPSDLRGCFDENLPPQYRCASHTLNLIASSDLEKGIRSKPDDKEYASCKKTLRATLAKCTSYWNKIGKSPLVAERVKNIIGVSVITPVPTRWNSVYDSVKQVLQFISLIDECFEIAQVEKLKQNEKDFLNDYASATEPIAWSLDMLQGEKSMFYGYLAPVLMKASRKLADLTKSEGENKNVAYIANILLSGINTRFKDTLQCNFVSCKNEFISSVLIPRLKLRWISNESKREELKKILILEADKIEISSEQIPISKVKKDFIDDLLDCEQDGSKNYDSAELECIKYLQDDNTELSTLMGYPRLKQLFFKFNTALTSSAPAERVFSLGKLIMRPNRARMSDSAFKQMAFLKLNSGF